MSAILQDGDLRLRPVRLPEDVDLALPWYRDPEVLRFSEGEEAAPYDRAVIDRMYRHLARRGELYITEVKTPAGWLAIGDAALCPDSPPIVIGDSRYRSKGFGSRALRLLVGRAKALGWLRLRSGKVFTYNARSRRLFEGQGFRLAGAARDQGGKECWDFVLDLGSLPAARAGEP